MLGESGSRGLTHRAVDEAADLPPGSTSNHFRTREALLEAAARRHAELDLPPTADVDAIAEPDAVLNWEQVRALLLAHLDRLLDPAGRALLTARYELALESTRRPSLHEVMDDSRQRFTGLAEVLLRAGGCNDPDTHAPQLIAAARRRHGRPAAGDQPGHRPRRDREPARPLPRHLLSGK